MRGYSAEQVRAAEAPLLAAGVPLMRRAAAGLAGVVRGLLPDDGGRVLVLAGTGNNGADALWAAAELAAAGTVVTVAAAGDRTEPESLTAARAEGAVLLEGAAGSPDAVARIAASVDVVIDGILGTGTSASPALRGRAREVVSALLGVARLPLVVAVDVPSGIDPTTGAVPEPVVLTADVTVTFGGCKAGLLRDPGARLAGEVRLIDIGLGNELAGMPALVDTGGDSDEPRP
jgi:NAD(P)H-hydrate epimerase